MTIDSSVCLQLGSVAAFDPSSYSKLLIAMNDDEIAAAKADLVASSIDKLDIVVDATDIGTLYNPMEIASWVPFLKADAVVSVQVQGSAASLQPVTTSFLLAGLASASERREADGSRVLTATRKVLPKVSAAPLKKPTTVTLTLDDDVDDDNADMVDEDALLDDTMLAPPPAMNAQAAVGGDDCAGRTACDNCTCGRAEQEAGAGQPKQAPASSCGKCSLGDAFRCASCPYLGKPAFKPGEEHLVLQLTDDL